MSANDQLFMSHWHGFLVNVESVGTWKIQQRGGAFVQELLPLFIEVLSELRSDPAGAAVREAIILQQEEDQGSQMLTYLAREMHFFDRLIASYGLEAGAQVDGNSVNEGLGSAKTIKESVEKWIGKRLPKRWTTVLEILNELLSLIKGG